MTDINFDSNFWNQTNGTYTGYTISGNTCTLTDQVNATGGGVPNGKTLKINGGVGLTVNQGKTFNLDGTISSSGVGAGGLLNYGTIEIGKYGTILFSNSTFGNGGIINLNGEYSSIEAYSGLQNWGIINNKNSEFTGGINWWTGVNSGTIINNGTFDAYGNFNAPLKNIGVILSSTIVGGDGVNNQDGGKYYYPGNGSTTNQIDITSNFTLPASSTFKVPNGKTLKIPNGVTFTI